MVEVECIKQHTLLMYVYGLDRIYIYSAKVYLIKLHEHVEYRITAVNKRIVSEYHFTDYANKICINQKGFGQGMGATNARQNLVVKRI